MEFRTCLTRNWTNFSSLWRNTVSGFHPLSSPPMTSVSEFWSSKMFVPRCALSMLSYTLKSPTWRARVGLPESVEGGWPIKFFSKLQCEVLGNKTLPSPPRVDSAHCSLRAKLAPGQQMRPVILRLHRYQTKNPIIREVWWRGQLHFWDQSIRIVKDYCPEVLSQRSEYKLVMAKLYQRGLRPALLYPVRLHIMLPDGVKKWIGSVEEVLSYLDKLLKDSWTVSSESFNSLYRSVFQTNSYWIPFMVLQV